MYIIHGTGIKHHFCNSYILAQMVRDNLFERYPDSRPEIGSFIHNEPDSYMWDSGGMVAGDALRFPIPGIELLCKTSQWRKFQDQVVNDLVSCNESKYGGFFKLHSRESILCLSKTQKQRLLDDFYVRQHDCERKYALLLEHI